MIHSSKSLHKFVPGLSFPVEILAEKDDRVMFSADLAQLLVLIMKDAVIGIGSRNRIKRLRLNSVVAQEAERMYKESHYSREDLKFTYRDNLPNRPVVLKKITPEGHPEEWSDDERFPQPRFNPDRIPKPLFLFASACQT